MNPLKKLLIQVRDTFLAKAFYDRRIARAAALRQELRPRLSELTPISDAGEVKYEIHMVCGKRDLDMGMWASWSILRFTDGHGSLIIHSDGSLGEAEFALWRKLVPRTRFITPSEAKAVVENHPVAQLKALYSWWSGWKSTSMKQVVDSQLVGTAPRILVMDSDVLCFSRPDAILEGLTESRGFLWCRDLRPSLIATQVELERAVGHPVAGWLNCGFIVSPRFTLADFQHLDAKIAALRAAGIDTNRYWSAQTMYGLLAGKSGSVSPLGPGYDNEAGRVESTTIIRHFVGTKAVRYRFFTEGVPLLLAQNNRG